MRTLIATLTLTFTFSVMPAGAAVYPPVDLSWMNYKDWSDWPMWHCVGQHETNMNWHHVSPSGRYRGAFGIYRGTWRAYGHPLVSRLWPDAEDAPPFAQIMGARAVRTHVGTRLWGGFRSCT